MDVFCVWMFLCFDVLYVLMFAVFGCFLCCDIFSTFRCFDVFYVLMFSMIWSLQCFLSFDVFYVLLPSMFFTYALMFSMFCCLLCFLHMSWCFLSLYLRKKVWRSTNKILPCVFHWHSEKTLPQKQYIVFVHNKKVTLIIQMMWPWKCWYIFCLIFGLLRTESGYHQQLDLFFSNKKHSRYTGCLTIISLFSNF